MRLIDADTIEQLLKEERDFHKKMCDNMQQPCEHDDKQIFGAYYTAYSKSYHAVKDAPTIDAVPVVRCRECYYKDVHKRTFDEDRLWCRLHHMYVTADWFCADGDRQMTLKRKRVLCREKRTLTAKERMENPMNELIDALQNCACEDGNGSCAKCAYKFAEFSCKWKMMIDAADAIERMQADIAKKDSQITEWKNAWRIANSLYKSAQAEIDEHRAYQHELVERIEQLKAELSELIQTEPTEPNEPKGDN